MAALVDGTGWTIERRLQDAKITPFCCAGPEAGPAKHVRLQLRPYPCCREQVRFGRVEVGADGDASFLVDGVGQAAESAMALACGGGRAPSSTSARLAKSQQNTQQTGYLGYCGPWTPGFRHL
jgi:hypothetical protein